MSIPNGRAGGGRWTRLAPSPTGALHLGNARTFLVNWLLARQRGWSVLLRVEDLDGPRVKAGADRQAIDDLCWLGLDWDRGPIYQAPRAGGYAAAVERLLASGDAYPCACTRREVGQSASAPHAEDGASVYPGTCRGRFAGVAEAWAESGRPPAIRLRVPDAEVAWVDQFLGPRRRDVGRELGDFVIARVEGPPPDSAPATEATATRPVARPMTYQAAYQLAVVVDDAEAGVTEVVRGDDLVDSTPRQRLVYRALGLGERIPRYWHLPLVIGEDGRRLAKRHGDTRLASYRQRGVSPGRVLALLARWSGVAEAGESIDLAALLAAFRPEAMPREPTIFTAADDAWLLRG